MSFSEKSNVPLKNKTLVANLSELFLATNFFPFLWIRLFINIIRLLKLFILIHFINRNFDRPIGLLNYLLIVLMQAKKSNRISRCVEALNCNFDE